MLKIKVQNPTKEKFNYFTSAVSLMQAVRYVDHIDNENFIATIVVDDSARDIDIYCIERMILLFDGANLSKNYKYEWDMIVKELEPEPCETKEEAKRLYDEGLEDFINARNAGQTVDEIKQKLITSMNL